MMGNHLDPRDPDYEISQRVDAELKIDAAKQADEHYRAHQGLDGLIQSRARLTHTHTTAGLAVSAETFDEIATKLRAADYGHVFHDENHMDMTGISLVREPSLDRPIITPVEPSAFPLNPIVNGKVVMGTIAADIAIERTYRAPVNAEGSGVNARQVGGAHYGLSQFQHWDMVALFKLDYFQGQVTKYIMRWREKNGIEDLEKAKHYLEKYIALEKAKHPKEPDSPARIG